MKKSKKEAYANADEFFEGLKDESEDYASRIVRDVLGKTHLRDDEVDGVRLPPSWSIRGIYERWVYEMGWIAKVGASGDSNYGKVENYLPRPNDEAFWPEGSTGKPVLCYTTFRKYWFNKYPQIKIAPSAKDTCDDCFQYSLAMTRLVNKNKNLLSEQVLDNSLIAGNTVNCIKNIFKKKSKIKESFFLSI